MRDKKRCDTYFSCGDLSERIRPRLNEILDGDVTVKKVDFGIQFPEFPNENQDPKAKRRATKNKSAKGAM